MATELLTKQFETLNISPDEALKHDVEYIIWLYYKEIPTINPNLLKLKKNTFINLYNNIINILNEKDETKNLLEMMPLIDEYLSYLDLDF